jgi:hypothetical protein
VLRADACNVEVVALGDDEGRDGGREGGAPCAGDIALRALVTRHVPREHGVGDGRAVRGGGGRGGGEAVDAGCEKSC